MDILFVVDNSGSMGQEQANLALQFPRFASVIHDYATGAGAALDYRLAVTTTGRDVTWTIDDGVGLPFTYHERGENGELVTAEGCNMPRKWLDRTDADVAGSLSCVAGMLGTGGPTYEMPLLMIDWALEDRILDGTNAGFLRDDALLAVVVLTDEDDCSREDDDFTVASKLCDPPPPEAVPVHRFVDLLDRLKGGRRRWAAAVIAGTGPGECTSDFGAAFEAKRLAQFVQLAGDNAVLSSICAGDLTGPLQAALSIFGEACERFPPIP